MDTLVLAARHMCPNNANPGAYKCGEMIHQVPGMGQHGELLVRRTTLLDEPYATSKGASSSDASGWDVTVRSNGIHVDASRCIRKMRSNNPAEKDIFDRLLNGPWRLPRPRLRPTSGCMAARVGTYCPAESSTMTCNKRDGIVWTRKQH